MHHNYIIIFLITISFTNRGILILLGQLQKILLAFSPLLEESDMGAENHKELICFVLGIFGKDLSNVICIVGDNCNLNKRLADICGAPLVGCAAHRFNLAVSEYLCQYEDLLTNVLLLSVIYFQDSFSSF
jgi:hypothetical protein